MANKIVKENIKINIRAVKETLNQLQKYFSENLREASLLKNNKLIYFKRNISIIREAAKNINNIEMSENIKISKESKEIENIKEEILKKMDILNDLNNSLLIKNSRENHYILKNNLDNIKLASNKLKRISTENRDELYRSEVREYE